jgi:hypothetical protein
MSGKDEVFMMSIFGKTMALPPTSLFVALMYVLCFQGAGISAQQKQNQTLREAMNAVQETQFEEKHREALSKNPEGITFTLRLARGEKTFRQGEIISLEQGFSSSIPNTYWMDNATFDRSGRLNMDRFHLEPGEGYVDPLRDYFNYGGGGMGGPRGTPKLKRKSYLIYYDLNEWFRFEKTGKYRLYLTTPRVSRIEGGQHFPSGDLTLTSNIIEFEIVPADREWQRQELERAVQALNSTGGNVDRRSACRVLRFLGTKGAAQEMIRRIGDEGDECGFEYYAGLIGSPHRDYAIDEMEKQLAAPSQPISSRYLSLLTSLVFYTQHPELSNRPSSGDQKVLEAFWKKLRESNSQIEKRYIERLAASVSLKSGRAKAISLNTLLKVNQEQLPATWKPPDVSSIFEDLPPGAQYGLLAGRWKQIASPAMLPVLRRIYESPPKTNGPDLIDVALRRIYELEPDEGRRLIIAEIQNPKPRVHTRVLKILPDQIMPELDSVLADNLEREDSRKDAVDDLIERYGSPALVGRVRSFYEDKEGRWACSTQYSLLAYISRVDPAAGAELVRRAMSFRGPDHTRCYTGTLREVGKRHSSKELEKVAIEFLNDPDPEVVVDSAAMLGNHGSADAEEPLWRRFETWHRQWAGRSQELQNARFDDEKLRLQKSLGTSLRQAISHSPAWLAGPDKLDRLRQLCVTDEERKQVDDLKAGWAGEIRIAFNPREDEWGDVHVAQYDLHTLAALKEKLTQFPKGTVFKWQTYEHELRLEKKEKLFAELKGYIDGQGMVLKR